MKQQDLFGLGGTPAVAPKPPAASPASSAGAAPAGATQAAGPVPSAGARQAPTSAGAQLPPVPPAGDRQPPPPLASLPPAPAVPGSTGVPVPSKGRGAAYSALIPAAVALAVPPVDKKPAGPRVLSVSELTQQLKDTLEPKFPRVMVRGEISGFRGANARGHLYFALKDDGASLNVNVWQSTAKTLKFALKEGLSVIAEGSIELYQPSGRYSLVVSRLEPSGVGAQALAFEQLKARLMAEGLFGEKRQKPRRPLPFLPHRIGVVTSLSGAALRDFLKVLHRRHPRLSVLVADARVQGDGAAQEISRAIARLGRTDVDVIVVTRGGGSAEDLWAFNEEAVVRAIFEAKVPVVSAVGHEIDVTLADLVADLRAPTPSAAAEAVAPVLADLALQVRTLENRLHKAVERRVMGARAQLATVKARLLDPRRALGQRRLHVSALAERLAGAWRKGHRGHTEGLKALERRLQRARPQARLASMRGQLEQLSARLAKVSVLPRLARERQRLSGLSAQLPVAMRTGLKHRRLELNALYSHLKALGPDDVLGRGYAIAFGPDQKIVRSAEQVAVGDELLVRFGKGSALQARVTAKKG